MRDFNYTFIERLLHRLALNYPSLAEVSFDIDQAMAHADKKNVRKEKHVFVCGLARAGSTVLMRRFHATGCYRSLTYRDMPFVLAPNVWRRLSSLSRRHINLAERAHGDRVMVNYDSPESFDEVFWRVFAGKQYLGLDRLVPHSPDEELQEKYTRYVAAVLLSQSPSCSRYLSKNNNNILRIPAILQIFPEALILVPFRQPLQHSSSLLRQHMRFSRMQLRSQFLLAYMNWLGHHEFGLGHRPFSFNASDSRCQSSDTLNYWLTLWYDVYSWLARIAEPNVFLVCYEDLCNDVRVWSRLAELANIPATNSGSEPLKIHERPIDHSFDAQFALRAEALYARLLAHSRQQYF